MAASFDNLEDVMSKFTGTVCYYDKKPALVRSCHTDPEDETGTNFILNVVLHSNGRGKHIKLNDPDFNYKDFNIGYANVGPYASWWFRRPHRQYRQGLRKDQMSWRMSNPVIGPAEGFSFSKPFNTMLENIYPDLEFCREKLVDHEAEVIAFHRDFAISWDDIHDDYILEYRGKRVGASVGKKLNNFRLVNDAKHLQEALQEALPNVHG